jgi:DNA-directed RNA polymerase II subunit RPB7
MGFFASVGPLNIFTSTHLLPLEFRFQPDSNPPEFSSPDGQVSLTLQTTFVTILTFLPTSRQSIVKDKKVRLRIVGTRVDASEIFAIGSCKEDYVGPFD